MMTKIAVVISGACRTYARITPNKIVARFSRTIGNGISGPQSKDESTSDSDICRARLRPGGRRRLVRIAAALGIVHATRRVRYLRGRKKGGRSAVGRWSSG